MGQQQERGRTKKLNGEVKQAVGIITGDSKLEREGVRQRAEGSAEEILGEARQKIGDLVDKVAKSIKD